MNKPFQVYLSERQRTALTLLSRKLGTPRAELVRMGVDRVIQELTAPQDDSAWALIGLAADSNLPPDLAQRHEDYLAADLERKRGR